MRKLDFYKFQWRIIKEKKYPSGTEYFVYRVYRKYFRRLIPLSNTRSSYLISFNRWNLFKKKLAKNPRFLPQQVYFTKTL